MSNNFVTLTHNKIKEKFSNYKREVGGILSIWNQVIGESLNSLAKQLELAKTSMFSYTSLSGDELDLRASEFYLYRIQPTISSGEILIYKEGVDVEVIQSRLFLKGGYASKENEITLSTQTLEYVLYVEEYNKFSIKPKNFINKLPVGFNCKLKIDDSYKNITITSSSPYKAYITGDFLDLPVSVEIKVFVEFFGNFVTFNSENTGFSQNLKPNTIMTSKNDNVYNLNFQVTNIGFSGGADLENDEHLRERIRLNTNGVISFFSVDSIKLDIYSNFGNIKKVGVRQPIQESEKGKVWVYVTENTNDYGIVNDETLTSIKNYLISIKPASILSSDIYVLNPFLVDTRIKIIKVEPFSKLLLEITKNKIKDYFKNLDINIKTDKTININLLINYLIDNVKDSSGVRLENIELTIEYINLIDNINGDGCIYEVNFD